MGYSKEHYKEEWEELKWEMRKEEQFDMKKLRELTDPARQEFNWVDFHAQYNKSKEHEVNEPESELTKFVRERIRKFYEK